MKKLCMVGTLLCFLAGGFSASAALPDDLGKASQYPVLQESAVSRQGPLQNALYLDTSSIHVVDVDASGMVLQANVIERTGKDKTLTHGVRYHLAEDGSEKILGLDGNWYSLPENSDDPSAVAAMLVRAELGKPERREQFVTEIQKILLAKQNGTQKEKMEAPNVAVTQGENGEAAVPAGDAVETPADGMAVEAPTDGTTDAVQETSPEAVKDAYAKSSAVRKEAQDDLAAEIGERGTPSAPSPEKEQPAGDAQNVENGKATATPKDAPAPVKGESGDTAKAQTSPSPQAGEKTENPPVVVQIESHEPQVHIEITPSQGA